MTNTSNQRPPAVAAALIGTVLTTAIVSCTAPDQTTTNPDDPAPAWGDSSSTTAPSTKSVAPPAPGDFVVGVIITEQKCFGSAGCNYRYTINPEYVSTKPLPEKTTVVFTVAGGEQDQIGNFTIDANGTATFDRETSISGPANADLRATVTQVIPDR